MVLFIVDGRTVFFDGGVCVAVFAAFFSMSVRLCQMPFDKDRSSSTSVQLFRQMPFDKKDLSMPFKRGLRQFTVEEKLDAVRRVHDGDSKASVARLLGVPESTLRGWCKNEKKLSFSLENSPVNNAVSSSLFNFFPFLIRFSTSIPIS